MSSVDVGYAGLNHVWMMNLLTMILNYGGHVKPLYTTCAGAKGALVQLQGAPPGCLCHTLTEGSINLPSGLPENTRSPGSLQGINIDPPARDRTLVKGALRMKYETPPKT
jgi:hypothetical protein